MKSELTEKWLVCRICLKQPKEAMHTIFDKDADKDLTQMILECGGVPIKQFDHYPDKICTKCHRYLQVAHKFRVTCQRSHKHLSKFIAPVVVEKVDELISVDEAEFGAISVDDEISSPLPEEPDDTVMKLESPPDENFKEEYALQLEEDENDFVEIYEPMTEEEVKEVFELDEEFQANDEGVNNFVTDQGEVEYLDIEEETQLQTSEEDYEPKVMRKRGRQPLHKRSCSLPSTSQDERKRVKREPKEKKNKETSFICDFCGNKYPSQGRLTEHIKLHKGIKPHVCEICGYAFAQTQQLARHMNTHTGNRPYKCNYCPAAFADLSTRNKHHRIHTNERPYVCDVCGKAFTYTNTLKFHKMIHTGEKPFVCEICGKGFQQSYKLRSHKMIHEKKAIKLEKMDGKTTQNFQDISIETVTQILNI